MKPLFKPGDVIRIPNYPTCKGFRVWMIKDVTLGAQGQENTVGMVPLDKSENGVWINVPMIMLETHGGIELV